MVTLIRHASNLKYKVQKLLQSYASLSRALELCESREVAVLGSPSLTVCMVSVDVKLYWIWTVVHPPEEPTRWNYSCSLSFPCLLLLRSICHCRSRRSGWLVAMAIKSASRRDSGDMRYPTDSVILIPYAAGSNFRYRCVNRFGLAMRYSCVGILSVWVKLNELYFPYCWKCLTCECMCWCV